MSGRWPYGEIQIDSTFPPDAPGSRLVNAGTGPWARNLRAHAPCRAAAAHANAQGAALDATRRSVRTIAGGGSRMRRVQRDRSPGRRRHPLSANADRPQERTSSDVGWGRTRQETEVEHLLTAACESQADRSPRCRALQEIIRKSLFMTVPLLAEPGKRGECLRHSRVAGCPWQGQFTESSRTQREVVRTEVSLARTPEPTVRKVQPVGAPNDPGPSPGHWSRDDRTTRTSANALVSLARTRGGCRRGSIGGEAKRGSRAWVRTGHRGSAAGSRNHILCG